MRGLVIALAALCAVPMTGCATARKAPVPSASQMLVVAGDADSAASAQAREASAARALSTVPLRAYPGEADADLLAALGEGAASERVARARDEAEDLRVPWLLVLEERWIHRVEILPLSFLIWIIHQSQETVSCKRSRWSSRKGKEESKRKKGSRRRTKMSS